jgi:hypothetical protein
MEFSCTKAKYVSNSSEMKNALLREMHNVPYVVHPRYQKTITVVEANIFVPE